MPQAQELSVLLWGHPRLPRKAHSLAFLCDLGREYSRVIWVVCCKAKQRKFDRSTIFMNSAEIWRFLGKGTMRGEGLCKSDR